MTTITDTDPGFKNLRKNLKGPDEIFAGLIGEIGEFLIIVGSALEFGTERIPARPYLRSTYDIHKEDIAKILEAQVVPILLGQSTKEKALKLAAVFFVGKVKERIQTSPSPFKENAKSTLKKKFPKNQPLIATVGRIPNSVTFGFKI